MAHVRRELDTHVRGRREAARPPHLGNAWFPGFDKLAGDDPTATIARTSHGAATSPNAFLRDTE
jgi:hypothetical protein